MKMLIMKLINHVDQHITAKFLIKPVPVMLTGVLILSTAGCGEINEGTKQNTVPLPTDSTLNFYCAEEGIYPDNCVLDNPENPYANVAVVSDPDNPDNPNDKFSLNNSAPSAKARYYLWATALAKGAGIPGENQYYTARALHEVFGESGSPTTSEQAKKAYRSVLDNFYFNPTFFVFPVSGEDVAIAAPLKDLTAQNLYEPVGLVSFYTDPVFALQEMSVWGYIYNTTTKTVDFFR